ncbi:unnamed protein product [Closterium sp. NIES-54]
MSEDLFLVSSPPLRHPMLSLILPSRQARCEFGLSAAEESLIASVVFLGVFLGSYMWGLMADAYGRRRGFMATALFTLFAGLLSAWSPTFLTLLVSRCLVGFGIGGASVVFSLCSEFLPSLSRGFWLVFIEFFWTIGSLIEAALAWAVMPSLHWRYGDLPNLLHISGKDRWPVLKVFLKKSPFLAYLVLFSYSTPRSTPRYSSWPLSAIVFSPLPLPTPPCPSLPLSPLPYPSCPSLPLPGPRISCLLHPRALMLLSAMPFALLLLLCLFLPQSKDTLYSLPSLPPSPLSPLSLRLVLTLSLPASPLASTLNPLPPSQGAGAPIRYALCSPAVALPLSSRVAPVSPGQ